MRHKEGKEGEIQFQEHGSHYGPKPTLAETDLLVRNNQVDDPKQHIPGDQTTEQITQTEEEVATGNLAERGLLQKREDKRRSSRGYDGNREDDPAQQQHDDAQQV